ncbi:RNA-directed DNA polymerase, eukaryota [Artemisia annua]|uniref:RNA-directed DNA polymerase, eukaryota n=1 Tax=Artemisia annua TaxID=35608 RepID=A0A2U1PFD3_ARTAN|nr:RNA-directed DNA polymerase, eukaryota [Artemisia annua]
MWGNYSFDYACSLARGRSGGIISIWDPAMFIKTNIWCDDQYVIVQGKWTNSDDMYFLINIYGPHDTHAKATLWNSLRAFIQTHNGKFMLFGDLNEVRDESEHYGSTFSRSEADCFNSFNELTNFVNANGWKETQDLKATVLERGKSDHNPIFLHIEKSDYGPYLFKFFHSWLKRPDFDTLIKKSIEDSSTITTTPGSRLKSRLKMLKEKIKEWHQSTKHIEQSQEIAHRNRIHEIDQKLDMNVGSDSDREERLKLLEECEELDHITVRATY